MSICSSSGRGLLVLLGGLALRHTGAQSQSSAIPPIRPLGPIVGVTQEHLAYVATIRVLSDGRILVNDTRARRVVLVDSSLAHGTTVADTTGETAKAYGANGGWLLPFVGDSSVFADFASLAFLVIDPSGKIRRTVAAPLSNQNLGYLSSAAIDPRGNVVSRQWAGRGVGGHLTNTRVSADGVIMTGGTTIGVSAILASEPPQLDPSAPPVVIQDSTVIVRTNIDTKRVDTVAWLMAPPSATVVTVGPNGARRSMMKNLVPVSDTWALLPDGTVAAIREHDYHIDWIAPDGTVISTPKIAHEWERLTDSVKETIIDSARRADSTAAERMRPRLDSAARNARANGGDADGVFIGGSGQARVQSGGGPVEMDPYMNPEDLPSYRPPFPQNDTLTANTARADADGNLWIRVNLPARPEGGFVYDVVNRQGRLVDRVQIPGGTHLVGFGPGVAYLISREGTGYTLARARIR